MLPFHARPGDVAISETASRNKNTGVDYYYVCDIVVAIKDDVAIASDGRALSGVRAIYRPGLARLDNGNGPVLLPRDPDKYDKAALVKALQKRYGAGELITGFACDGKACGVKKQV